MDLHEVTEALNRQAVELATLNRLIRVVIFLLVALCFLVFIELAVGDDIALIRADKAKLPRRKLLYTYYIRLDNIPPERRLQTQRAMDFVVASCSSQPILERSLPVRLSETLYRIDLEDLRWQALPKILIDSYPYKSPSQIRSGRPPGAFRADWFVDFVLDQTESDAYLQLLYGRRVPKDADDLLKLYEVADNELVNNWVEDQSGVAVNGTRLLKAFPSTLRSDVWRTFDFKDINPATDPLQNFDKQLDGAFSEYIAPLIKVSLTTGEQGHLQQYALTDNENNVAAAAPIDVVIDHTGVGGTPELVNPRSCFACHVEGLRPLTINSVRRLIEAKTDGIAVARIAPKSAEERERIERQFLGRLNDSIEIHNQKFAATIRLITGGTPQQASSDVVSTIRNYNNAVDLKMAAAELRVTPRQLRLALATSGSVSARLAQLPAVPMTRENWEAIYLEARRLVDSRWRVIR